MSQSLRPLLRRRAPRAAMLVCAMGIAAAALPPVARADRSYTVRFTQNAQGDITGTGNTLLSCRDTDANCANAREGNGANGTSNNNGIAMDYVDVDRDSATFDSSAAALRLPPRARVLFAGLYYGGRSQAGSGGNPAPDANARDKLLLRPPNLGTYIPLTAAVVDDAPVNPSAGAALRLYGGFVDVNRHRPGRRQRRVHRRERAAGHRPPGRPVGRLDAGGG